MTRAALLRRKGHVPYTPVGGGGGGGGSENDWMWNLNSDTPPGKLLTHPGDEELDGISFTDINVSTAAQLVSAVAAMAPGKKIVFQADIQGDAGTPNWWDWTATGNWAGSQYSPCVVDLNGFTYTSKATDDVNNGNVNQGWGEMMSFRSFTWLYVMNGSLVGASPTRAWSQSCINFGYESGAGIGTWSNARLYGVKIDGCGGAAVHIKGNGGGINATCQDAKILGCEVTNVGYREDAQFGEGIYVGQGSGGLDRNVRYVEIGNTWMHDQAGVRTLNSAQGGEAIDIKHYGRDVHLHDVLIEDWNPWSQGAITMNHDADTGWGSTQANQLIERVLIRNVNSMRNQYGQDGSGMCLGGPGTVVKDSLVVGCGGHGINASTYPTTGGQTPTVTVENVTVWDSDSNDFETTAGSLSITNSISQDGTGGTTAASSDFVGPLTGDMDAGDGNGSGFKRAGSSIALGVGVQL